MSQLFFRNPLQIFVNYDKIENEISAPLCVLSDFCERSWHFSCFRQHIGSKSSLPADMMHQASNRPQYCPAAGYQLIKEFRHMAKIRVAVLFGGVSSEHDVSLISAENVIRSIPRTNTRYCASASRRRAAGSISPATSRRSPPAHGNRIRTAALRSCHRIRCTAASSPSRTARHTLKR